ncbi:peptidoglycan-binding protein [Rhodohalobacter sp. SW132]|uniref:peptidoglycan-binding domain-containing protein n=1 Tax=Rhodohalobacter sp. SW132 TaxID=2293433 RepID=UPI000E236A6E|nr:peptidoglycan-binding domain-containing protein [Rhodohalobacter sp. SW132]REL33431.1 peptidoglycan-binding protein [Rhodohalobacter sp. SW132]
MKTPLKPITRNQQTHNVSLLQKALAALGFSVSQEVVIKSIAGKDTIKKVRELQAKLKVPVDNNFVVDKATALAISKELMDRGLTDASHSFKVSGQVRLANGDVKIR